MAFLCMHAIKVGYPLILGSRRNIISEVNGLTGLPVICDSKIANVPHIARKIARKCFNMGADAITVHGFVGPETIRTCVEEAGVDKDVIVITYMTHPDADLFMERIAERVVEIAKGGKATAIQAPGNRPETVRRFRRIIGDSMVIMCCGIGAQGGKVGKAIEAGADFEIIGRTIYSSACPEKTTKRIANKLRSSLESYEKNL